MARKKGNTEEEAGASWMDTYGDMVTLILTFFVLLYSFSSFDVSKWKELVQAFTGSPPSGVITPINPINPSDKTQDVLYGMKINDKSNKSDKKGGEKEKDNAGAGKATSTQMLTEQNIDVLSRSEVELRAEFNAFYEEINQFIESNSLDSLFSAEKQGNQILLVVMDGVLFDSAKADLKNDAAKEVLVKVADITKRSQDLIANMRVEGHTDNVPINNAAFTDNWDLSAMRATNVLRFMISDGGFPATKISCSGYGDQRPIASNDTDEGKAKNRRVTFLIERVLSRSEVEG